MHSLALQVQQALGRDPHCGDLYVFRGRKADLIKIVWHDGVGMSLYAKKIGEGTLHLALASRRLPTDLWRSAGLHARQRVVIPLIPTQTWSFRLRWRLLTRRTHCSDGASV